MLLKRLPPLQNYFLQKCSWWCVINEWNWCILTAANYKPVSRQLENSRQFQNNTGNSAMSKSIYNVINQVIWYFLTNCFTFLTKSVKLQVWKSQSCRIFAIFFQCFFMIEIQVLMRFQFFWFFSRNHFLKGGLGVCFSDRGASFLSGSQGCYMRGLVLMGGFWKRM